MLEFPIVPYVEKAHFLLGYFDGEKTTLEEHINGNIVKKSVSDSVPYVPGSTLKIAHHGNIVLLTIEPPRDNDL